MMKRYIGLICITITLISVGNDIQQPSLPLKITTDHFMLYCMENDQEAANEVLVVAEENFTKLSEYFNHQYSAKISLYVFPSIQEHHNAIGEPLAENWVINSVFDATHSFYTVSPRNPGSSHTANSVLRLNIVGLCYLFIKDKYTGDMPYWFSLAIGLRLAGYTGQQLLPKFAQNHAIIPSFEQLAHLSVVQKSDERSLIQACVCSMVEYITLRFGHDKILALLNDFSSFELLLGMSREEFREQWIRYIDDTYLIKIVASTI